MDSNTNDVEIGQLTNFVKGEIMEEKTYCVVKFRQNGTNEIVEEGLTREEAQEMCSQPDTSGGNPAKGTAWFLGFEEE